MVTVQNPPTGETTPARGRRRAFLSAAVVAIVALVLGGLGGYAMAGGFESNAREHVAETASPGQQIVDKVLKAWHTTNPANLKANIDAAFTPDAIWVQDGEVAWASRAEFTSMLSSVLRTSKAEPGGIRQVGPVAEQAGDPGDEVDLWVSVLLYVLEPGEEDRSWSPQNQGSWYPMFGYLAVHDGKVIRSVGMSYDWVPAR